MGIYKPDLKIKPSISMGCCSICNDYNDAPKKPRPGVPCLPKYYFKWPKLSQISG